MPDAEIADAFGSVAGVENGGATDPLHAENGSAAVKQQPGQTITFRPVKPYLVIQAPKAAEAISFYKKAFGAEELSKVFFPKRKADQEQLLIMHAHIRFGDSEIFVMDETEESGAMGSVKSPSTLSGTSLALHLDTNDVDAAFARAVEAGATVLDEVSDQFWGDRYGRIVDPYGYVWSLATPLLKETVAVTEDPVEAGQAA